MNIDNIILSYRRPLTIFFHIVMVITAYIFSFYLRFEFSIPVEYIPRILKTLPLLIFIKVGVFYYFNLFIMVWHYVNLDDLWQILKAISISSMFFTLAVIFIFGISDYPRSIFILDWGICLGSIAGSRVIFRFLRQKYRPQIKKMKKMALIVGAGEAGILVLREIRNNSYASFKVAGFVDDDPAKKGLSIHGIRVIGTRKDIPYLVNKYSVEEIIIAMPSVRGEVVRDIIRYCQISKVRISIVPKLHKIISGELEVKLREVRPEDLIGRTVVKIDEIEIGTYLRDKRILVTGAGGSIGSELCRQIVKFAPSQLIILDHNENDVYFLEVEFKTKYPNLNLKTAIGNVGDVWLLRYIFKYYKPQIIFHSAAHKHVPLMEENPSAAVRNNIINTRNIIYAAHHYKGEKFILVSTDKAVNPISVMGISKKIAEMILQSKAKKSQTKFMAVRFGNVIGSSGSVVPLFKKQIAEGGPVTISHPEASRFFMSIEEATQLILQAGAIGRGGEVFVLDMGEQIKILDLANNLIALSGFEVGKDIPIKYINLRPGEKLSEDILSGAEKYKVTRNDNIYIIDSTEINNIELNCRIKELEKLSNTMDKDRIIEKMREMVQSLSE